MFNSTLIVSIIAIIILYLYWNKTIEKYRTTYPLKTNGIVNSEKKSVIDHLNEDLKLKFKNSKKIANELITNASTILNASTALNSSNAPNSPDAPELENFYDYAPDFTNENIEYTPPPSTSSTSPSSSSTILLERTNLDGIKTINSYPIKYDSQLSAVWNETIAKNAVDYLYSNMDNLPRAKVPI